MDIGTYLSSFCAIYGLIWATVCVYFWGNRFKLRKIKALRIGAGLFFFITACLIFTNLRTFAELPLLALPILPFYFPVIILWCED